MNNKLILAITYNNGFLYWSFLCSNFEGIDGNDTGTSSIPTFVGSHHLESFSHVLINYLDMLQLLIYQVSSNHFMKSHAALKMCTWNRWMRKKALQLLFRTYLLRLNLLLSFPKDEELYPFEKRDPPPSSYESEKRENPPRPPRLPPSENPRPRPLEKTLWPCPRPLF